MDDSLLGQLLIAMPGLKDPRFQKSVILICEFSKKAIMGLILNKEIYDLKLSTLLDKINVSNNNNFLNHSIFNGGPVHTNQGFILHTGKNIYKTTEKIIDNISITTSVEILEDFANNKGPDVKKIFMGCSVWEYDQFNREMLENSWLSLKAQEDLIFEEPSNELLWTKCLQQLGIKEENLVSFSGKA